MCPACFASIYFIAGAVLTATGGVGTAIVAKKAIKESKEKSNVK